MQDHVQQKPCRLAVQNDKNESQDFDSIPELPAGACAKMCQAFSLFELLWGIWGHVPRKNFTKLQSNLRDFSALWNHF